MRGITIASKAWQSLHTTDCGKCEITSGTGVTSQWNRWVLPTIFASLSMTFWGRSFTLQYRGG